MTSTPARTTHPVLALFSGLVALSAWAGALALLIGVIDFGPEITGRLPFRSTVFAGVALALVVAVPMTATSWLCARNRPQWRIAGVVAGTMLIGWIAVQIAVVQTFSWLQPAMAAAGVAVLVSALFTGRDN